MFFLSVVIVFFAWRRCLHCHHQVKDTGRGLLLTAQGRSILFSRQVSVGRCLPSSISPSSSYSYAGKRFKTAGKRAGAVGACRFPCIVNDCLGSRKCCLVGIQCLGLNGISYGWYAPASRRRTKSIVIVLSLLSMTNAAHTPPVQKLCGRGKSCSYQPGNGTALSLRGGLKP